MKRILITGLILNCTLGYNPSQSESTSAPLVSTFVTQMDEYLNAQWENGNFNGNVLIAKGDSILYSKSFGMANRELKIENSDSTKFLIGSITKPFTAFAILHLEK